MSEEKKFQPYFNGHRIVYPGATQSEQEAYEFLDRKDPLLKRYFENGSVSDGRTNQKIYSNAYGRSSL